MRSRAAAILHVVSAAICVLAAAPSAADAQSRPPLGGKQAEEYASYSAKLIADIEKSLLFPLDRARVATIALNNVFGAYGLAVAAADVRALETTAGDLERFTAAMLTARAPLGAPADLPEARELRLFWEGIASALPNQIFLVTRQTLARAIALRNAAWGYGLEVDFVDRGDPLVTHVHSGGPAQAAGIAPGDRLISIDRARMTPDTAHTLHFFPATAERPRAFEVRKPDGKQKSIAVTPFDFAPETVLGRQRKDDGTWIFWVPNRTHRIAHLRIAAFTNTTGVELEAALAALERDKAEAVLIDLRHTNPFGNERNANELASALFLGGSDRLRHRFRTGLARVVERRGPALFPRLPVYLLVGKQTAGPAEVFAACLQEFGRARVFGQRTVGDATIKQTIGYALDAGTTQFHVPIGEFLRRDGKRLHRLIEDGPHDSWGVRPDEGYEAPATPDLDLLVFKRWDELTARPGGVIQALDMDDPTLDPPGNYAAEKSIVFSTDGAASGSPAPRSCVYAAGCDVASHPGRLLIEGA